MDKIETGSEGLLLLQSLELSMWAHTSSWYAQVVVDPEEAEGNMVPVWMLPGEAALDTHTEVAAVGSCFHMDIVCCYRMAAPVDFPSAVAGLGEELSRCHIEEAAVVAAGSQTWRSWFKTMLYGLAVSITGAL